MLDINDLAEGKAHCDVTGCSPSPCHTRVAIGVDYTGYETYDYTFRDPATGKEVGDKITGTSGSFMWGHGVNDCFYMAMDDAHRPYKLWRHTMGTAQAKDVCLFTEADEKFWAGIARTDDKRFLVLESSGKITSECYLLDLTEAASPSQQLKLVQAREHDVLYSVETWEDLLLVMTNKDAKNFKLCFAPLSAVGSSDAPEWQDLIPHDPARTLEELSVFKNFLVIYGREGGLAKIWTVNTSEVRAYATAVAAGDTSVPAPKLHAIPSFKGEANCVMEAAAGNYTYEAPFVRYSYSSMVTPNCVVDYFPHGKAAVDTRQWGPAIEEPRAPENAIVRKMQEVPGYDPTLYRTIRTFAKAPDGRDIPMSILYRPDKYKPHHTTTDLADAPYVGASPVLLYGYGSYGMSMDPWFNSDRFSLVDRGVAYVIAHIRGGSEMGRFWYEAEGKLLNKRNTFTVRGARMPPTTMSRIEVIHFDRSHRTMR